VRLEHPLAGTHPFLRPGDIVLALDLVIVLIVLVADIERRVRKDQVRERFAHPAQHLDAVAADDLVKKLLHSDILGIRDAFASKN